MPSTSVRRSTLLVLVFVTLLASAWPCSAAVQQTAVPSPRGDGEFALPGIFDRLWGALQLLGTRAGCAINLDACANAASLSPPVREGCGIDPNGRCPVQTKEGCGIDPDGRCLP